MNSPVFPDMPQLIIEAGFTNGAQTGAYWHIGDAARGKIGTFALPGNEVWTDISAYALGLLITAGSSSRTTVPLVQWEAGTMQVPLDNGLRPDGVFRAFDPFNTASPFYQVQTSTVVPVPGTITQPSTAVVTFDALDAQAATTSTGTTFAAAQTTTPVSWAANNATATGLSSGSVPNGMLFGSSGFNGANRASGTLTLLNPQIARAYEDAASTATFGTTAYARFVPSTLPQLLTMKGSKSVWANPSSDTATYNTEVGHARAILRGLSNIPGHRSSFWHEPANPSANPDMLGPDWAAANINYKRDVIDVVNTDVNRTHPIWCEPVNNGFPSNATQDTYWPNSLLAVIDIMNWDCYGFVQHHPGTGGDQVTRLHDYATQRGLPWGIGEIGYTVNPNNTDGQEKNFTMVPLMDYIASLPPGERPKDVLWFNAKNNLLDNYPNAAAFWKDVCTNSTVPETV